MCSCSVHVTNEALAVLCVLGPSVGCSLLENMETKNTLDKCLNEVGESSLVGLRGWRMKSGLVCPLSLLSRVEGSQAEPKLSKATSTLNRMLGFPFSVFFLHLPVFLFPVFPCLCLTLPFKSCPVRATLGCTGPCG